MKKEFNQLVDKVADRLSKLQPFAGKVAPRQVSTTRVEAERVHKVKLISREPFCALVPSELLGDCDTWVLEPFQKRCRQGHKIIYVEEKADGNSAKR